MARNRYKENIVQVSFSRVKFGRPVLISHARARSLTFTRMHTHLRTQIPYATRAAFDLQDTSASVVAKVSHSLFASQWLASIDTKPRSPTLRPGLPLTASVPA